MAGDRVVDGVQAGGSNGVPLLGGCLAGQLLYEVVEVGEEFGGVEFQVGQSMNGGAQAAHGCGGGQAVTEHVTHDEGHPEGGQGDDVVPVAADLGAAAGGPVEADGLRRRGVGGGTREEALLQGDGCAVLAGVAAGVVHTQRGPRGDLGQKVRVLLLEGLGLLGTPDRDLAEHQVAGEHRSRDDRMHALGDGQRVAPALKRGEHASPVGREDDLTALETPNAR